MFAELAILSVSYVGYRLLESYRGKGKEKEKASKNVKNKKEKNLPATLGREKNLPTTLDEKQDHSATEKKHNYYLKMSVISAAFALVRTLNPLLSLISAGLITHASFPTFRKAEKLLVSENDKKFGNELAVSMTILMCVTYEYQFAASVSIFFHHLGSKLVAKTKGQSKKLLTDIFEHQNRRVWILRDGAEVELPLETLCAGDVIVVNTGEVIPIDGTVMEGESLVDQHVLTGESQPAEKKPGDQVLASTTVIAGKLNIKVEKSGHETTAAQIAHILIHSADFKTNLHHKCEDWADLTARYALLTSVLSFPLLGPASSIILLNSKLGNRIRIVASIGTLNHVKLAAQKGVFVKDGRALEQLKNADCFLFDKTGTLTNEQPEVGQIVACNRHDKNDVLRYAAIAEGHLTHPIAKAIMEKAHQEGLTIPSVSDSQYEIGYGISVLMEEQHIKVGSERFMLKEGISVPALIENAITAAHDNGFSMILVAVNEQLIGAIELKASIRSEARALIQGLRQRGIKHISIVSGDHKHPTKQLAESLEMDHYFHDILPENKADIVKQLREEGHTVCFVGDGINDLLAMKESHVSISLKGAQTIATDTAQVVLTEDNVSLICDLHDISREVDANLRNNLVIAAIPSFVNIAGVFTPGFGVLMSYITKKVSLLAGIGNAMLPLRKAKKKELENNRPAKESDVGDDRGRASRHPFDIKGVQTEALVVGTADEVLGGDHEAILLGCPEFTIQMDPSPPDRAGIGRDDAILHVSIPGKLPQDL